MRPLDITIICCMAMIAIVALFEQIKEIKLRRKSARFLNTDKTDLESQLENKSWAKRTENSWTFYSPEWQETRPDHDQSRWDDGYNDVR